MDRIMSRPQGFADGVILTQGVALGWLSRPFRADSNIADLTDLLSVSRRVKSCKVRVKSV